ncbi:MAG: endoribonuclease MazF [Elusimicrobia bacterium]|nr:endoribonuclease MazF [Elusimicrobiota bacterium]
MSVPDRGDFVWLDFDPRAGHEQGGHRPAIVLSPKSYNAKTGMALCCPITSRPKGYAFEFLLPPGDRMVGAVLADHIRNIDWKARRARKAGRASEEVVSGVLGKLGALLGMPSS